MRASGLCVYARILQCVYCDMWTSNSLKYSVVSRLAWYAVGSPPLWFIVQKHIGSSTLKETSNNCKTCISHDQIFSIIFVVDKLSSESEKIPPIQLMDWSMNAFTRRPPWHVWFVVSAVRLDKDRSGTVVRASVPHAGEMGLIPSGGRLLTHDLGCAV